MSLVVSVLTHDCVWQVADRCLTNVQTGQRASLDTNKAIHFAQAMLFAYTGPAELEGKDTAAWIADQLWKGKDPDEGLTALHVGHERAIPSIRHRELRAFAVDGAGWGLDRLTGAVAPRLLRFSNCLNDDGIWIGVQREQITVCDGLLKPHAGLNMRPAAGQPVPLVIGRHWERQIRRRLEIGAPLGEIGSCLVQLVRDVAAGNPAVAVGSC